MNWILIDQIIKNALIEDIGHGDITTESLIDETTISSGNFIAKANGVVAGLAVAKRVFALIDPSVNMTVLVEDGSHVSPGNIMATISGPARAILQGERVALNFLQRMSGCATLTAYYAGQIADLPSKIVDTRKTTPGLRPLEKYAVRMGGGANHRYNLTDCIMMKDNHIQAAGGIEQAITKAKEKLGHTIKIEVEAETMAHVVEALEAGADIIMLDNMDCAMMKKAVDFIGGRAITEASGNIDQKGIRDVALTGVDVISLGAITHSYTSLDISLKF
jgi:nicotinate-nucleotide pyrophosphorylase (carboxylating)